MAHFKYLNVYKFKHLRQKFYKKVYCLFLIFRNKNNKTLILLHFTKKTILSYIQKPQKQQLKSLVMSYQST